LTSEGSPHDAGGSGEFDGIVDCAVGGLCESDLASFGGLGLGSFNGKVNGVTR
jgi:hypothetical protein